MALLLPNQTSAPPGYRRVIRYNGRVLSELSDGNKPAEISEVKDPSGVNCQYFEKLRPEWLAIQASTNPQKGTCFELIGLDDPGLQIEFVPINPEAEPMPVVDDVAPAPVPTQNLKRRAAAAATPPPPVEPVDL